MTVDDTTSAAKSTSAAASLRRMDRELRARYVAEGLIVPRRQGRRDPLDEHVDSLPALTIDDAGRRSAARPVEVDRFGRLDLERVNLGHVAEERWAS